MIDKGRGALQDSLPVREWDLLFRLGYYYTYEIKSIFVNDV